MATNPVLKKEGEYFVKELQRSMIVKDFIATGQTIAAIRFEVLGLDTLQVLAPDYIEDLESGIKPGGRVDIARLTQWLNARRLNMQPNTLAYLLKKRGSRLYRGEDPRFPGKRKSGVISNVINKTTAEESLKRVADSNILNLKLSLKRLF